MYYIRYLVCFFCEAIYSFPHSRHIQSLGHKQGSLSAWLSWADCWARYSATWKHPLWICVRRDKFCNWMREEI